MLFTSAFSALCLNVSGFGKSDFCKEGTDNLIYQYCKQSDISNNGSVRAELDCFDSHAERNTRLRKQGNSKVFDDVRIAFSHFCADISSKILAKRTGYYVDKTYYAVINGIVTKEDVLAFSNGLEIGDEDLNIALPATLTILAIDEATNCSQVHVTIQEGKFHQVKRMCANAGKNVLSLKRVAIGALQLDPALQPGDIRELTESELTLFD